MLPPLQPLLLPASAVSAGNSCCCCCGCSTGTAVAAAVLIDALFALQRTTLTSPPAVLSCMSASCSCPTVTLPPAVDTPSPQKRLGMVPLSTNLCAASPLLLLGGCSTISASNCKHREQKQQLGCVQAEAAASAHRLLLTDAASNNNTLYSHRSTHL